MVNRKTFPAYGNCSIALATEEMKDGRWAVVVTVTQSTDTADETPTSLSRTSALSAKPRPRPSGCEARKSGLTRTRHRQAESEPFVECSALPKPPVASVAERERLKILHEGGAP